MLEYEFKILCADSGKSCEFVKLLMHDDFNNVHSVDSRKPFDHIGTLKVSNPNEALAKILELKQKAGDSVRNIEISLV